MRRSNSRGCPGRRAERGGPARAVKVRETLFPSPGLNGGGHGSDYGASHPMSQHAPARQRPHAA
jgi:hypothetical protein